MATLPYSEGDRVVFFHGPRGVVESAGPSFYTIRHTEGTWAGKAFTYTGCEFRPESGETRELGPVEWPHLRAAILSRYVGPWEQTVRVGNVDFYVKGRGCSPRYSLPYAEWDWNAIRADLGRFNDPTREALECR